MDRERVAVVGSREGADLEQVSAFLAELRVKHPLTTIISGGAKGVDKAAEEGWLALGGHVHSYRPKQIGLEEYGVEFWDLGGEQPRVFLLTNEPTFADYASACNYRDLLIAEECDRLAVFYAPGRSRGAAFTAEMAGNFGKPVYEFEKELIAA